jgi:hypothetical protein
VAGKPESKEKVTTFPAYASNFEFCPQDGEAWQHLAPLFAEVKRVDFQFHVADPSVNQGQMTADFDDRLESALHAAGAERFHLKLQRDIPQELDFAFSYQGKTVAVEIEKANREKILRDLLKCHMYLHSGADYSLIVLPRNYPHTHGIWDLFRFGVERYTECLKYGMGTRESLGRVLLVGYTQYDGQTGEKLSAATRERMRKLAQETKSR